MRSAVGGTSRRAAGRSLTERSSLTSVDKAFALLSAFGDEAEVGVTVLARRAGVPKSTAHRLLLVLEQQGLVIRSGMRYSLGVRLFELGSRVPFGSHAALRERAIPGMEDLYEASHGTIHLTVLDGAESLYIEKLHGRRSFPTPTHVGARLPAHCTGVGKAMLAFVPRARVMQLLDRPLPRLTPRSIVEPAALLREFDVVRARGWSYDREEATPGLGCVAAPIFSSGDVPVAAVSVSGPVRTVTSYAPAVVDAATQIGRALAA